MPRDAECSRAPSRCWRRWPRSRPCGEELNTGENLLFSREDFRPEPATRPEHTRTAAAPPQRPAEAAPPSARTASSDGQIRNRWQRGGDEPAKPTVLRTVGRGLLRLAVALLVLWFVIVLIAVIAQVVAQAVL